MRSSQIHRKLKNKLDSKNISARELTWDIIKKIGKGLNLSLDGIVANFTWEKEEVFSEIRNKDFVNHDRIIHFVNTYIDQIKYFLANPNKFTPYMYSKVSEVYAEFIQFIKDNKPENEQLKIEPPAATLILHLYSLLHALIQHYNNPASMEDIDISIKNLEKGLECFDFMSKQCLLANEKYSTEKFNNEFKAIYMSLAKIYIAKKSYAKANSYLNLYKKRINALEIDEIKKIELLLEFYLDKCNIALQLGDYSSAKDYYFKACAQADLMFDKNKSIHIQYFKTASDLFRYLYNKHNFLEALVYLRKLQELLEQQICYVGNNDIEIYTGWQKQTADNIVNTEFAYFKQNYEYLNDLAKEVMRLEIGYHPALQCGEVCVGSFSNPTLLSDFANILEANGILFQKNTTNIKILGLKVADMLGLRAIVVRFVATVNLQIPNAAITQAEGSLPEAEKIADDITSLALAENNNNNTKIANTNSVIKRKENNSTAVLKSEKVIDFGDDHIYRSQGECTVYKLYPPYVKRNYLYVEPRLLQDLALSYPEAYHDLLRTCESGRVLGSSRGRKGFIIRGTPFNGQSSIAIEPVTKVSADNNNNNNSANNQKKNPKNKKKNKKNKNTKPQNVSLLAKGPTLFIKFKNCSKDFRAYGHAEMTKEMNGKRYTLFVIDSFSPSHKKKAGKIKGPTPGPDLRD